MPDAFAKGTFDRFCVRGGAEISAAWKDHQLTAVLLKATADNTFVLKIPDYAKNITFEKNKVPAEIGIIDGMVELTLKRDETVQMIIHAAHVDNF